MLAQSRSNTAVAAWWARVDKYHSKHWLTKLLSVTWNAIGDTAAGAALRPPPATGDAGAAHVEAVRRVREAAGACASEDGARLAEWLTPLREGSGTVAEVS
jgi:hypothetical protein